MKKLICFFLSLIMITSIFALPVSAATSEQTKLMNYVNPMVGQSFKSNSCQAFVYQSLNKCLGVKNTKTSCCASKAWQNYGVSSSRNNIPLGAAVYFSGSSITDSYCGQKAGHVGLYVGNNNIVHVWGGKIKKTTIDYVIKNGYPYRGWGWQGEYSLTAQKPTITMKSYPKTIKKGKDFALDGSVNANELYTTINAYVTTSTNPRKILSTGNERTSSSNFQIMFSKINTQLPFNKLGKGTYKLTITATNSKGTTTFSKNFTVK